MNLQDTKPLLLADLDDLKRMRQAILDNKTGLSEG